MPQLILCDKSDLFRRNVSSMLKSEGYEVIPAEVGSKVLNLVLQSRPAAVIIDTEVESPSGLETLRLIKGDPKLKKLPVIMVSRNGAPSDVSNAFKMGAEGFLIKPIDMNALVKTLNSLRVPVPEFNSPIEVQVGATKITCLLRFIDQYGQVYLDKEQPDMAGPTSSMAIMNFEGGKTVYNQVMLIDEENEQGISLVPVSQPAEVEKPDLIKVPVSLKCRYMFPGSFMRLADVSELTASGLTLRGLAAEPAFNAEVTINLYSQGAGGEGIPLRGKLAGYRPGGAEGLFDADVLFTELVGLPYVHLMAELLGGRPPRPSPKEAPVA